MSASSSSGSASSSSSGNDQIVFKVGMINAENASDFFGEEQAGQSFADDEELGFAVVPRRDCPHLGTAAERLFDTLTQVNHNIVKNSKCQERGCNASENWLCVTCGGTFCSRYANSHMLKHNEEHADHHMAISFSDLSVWCYSCQSYVELDELAPVLSLLHQHKFGVADPSAASSSAGAGPSSASSSTKQEDKKEEEKPAGSIPRQDSKEDMLVSAMAAVHIEDQQQAQEEAAQIPLADLTGEARKKEIERRRKQFIKQVAEKIRGAQNILVLTGAGLSTESGIPDFRTPGTGLYYNLQQYRLPDPTAIFELNFFKSNPKPFYQLAKGMMDEFQPNIGHYFITLLDRKQKLLRNFTQNIDGLEILAQLPKDKLVQCHGTFETATCQNNKCRAKYDKEYVKRFLHNDKDKDNQVTVPVCEKCGAVVKCDIVFFGESLPAHFGRLSIRDVHEADLLIVIGTSLTVYPVAGLPDMVRSKACPRVLINRDLGGSFVDPIEEELAAAARKQNNNNDASRARRKSDKFEDYFLQGSIGDVIRELTKELGWQDDLDALMAPLKHKPSAASAPSDSKL